MPPPYADRQPGEGLSVEALQLQRIQLASTILSDTDLAETKRLQGELLDQQQDAAKTRLATLDARIKTVENESS